MNPDILAKNIEQINELLRTKKYDELWEKVKYIGFPIVRDIEDRKMCFYAFVETLDVNKKFHPQYIEKLREYKQSLHQFNHKNI